MSEPVKSTPKDFFSHLLAFIALYVSIVSFITLWFQYINVQFPDPLEYLGNVFGIVRWSTASFLVMWPVFLFLSHLTRREERASTEKREMRIRKWLLNLTVFASALTLIIDLITLVYRFLGGELTTRFGLKVVVVLVVAGAVFWYYLGEGKRGAEADFRKSRILAWGASGIILASIVAGFFLVGSPTEQRQIRFDEQRVQDLSNIQSGLIYQYWMAKNTLPDSLTDLANLSTGFAIPLDPATREPYAYRKISDLSFELCATFALDSKDALLQRTSLARPALPLADAALENWDHPTGQHCFSRMIDPDLYPKQKGMEPR